MEIMRVMKKIILNSMLCLGPLLAGAGESTWLSDLPKAQAKAKAEGKIVLMDFTGSEPAVSGISTAKPAPAPAAPVAKPVELKLKGISGAATRRFALINSQTVTVGEEFRIKLAGGVTRVRCLEIKDKSVVISLNG